MLPLPVLNGLAAGDWVSWLAIGNNELRRGVVVANYPCTETLWVNSELAGLPDLLLVVEYKQVTDVQTFGPTAG